MEIEEKTLLDLASKVKKARSNQGWSQSTLAYKSGTSEYAVGKIENGKTISDSTMGKILLTLGLKNDLSYVRVEKNKSSKYKEFSIEELRSCSAACKDIIRDGSDDDKREVISYKKAADREILIRLRDAFRGEMPTF